MHYIAIGKERGEMILFQDFVHFRNSEINVSNQKTVHHATYSHETTERV